MKHICLIPPRHHERPAACGIISLKSAESESFVIQRSGRHALPRQTSISICLGVWVHALCVRVWAQDLFIPVTGFRSVLKLPLWNPCRSVLYFDYLRCPDALCIKCGLKLWFVKIKYSLSLTSNVSALVHCCSAGFLFDCIGVLGVCVCGIVGVILLTLFRCLFVAALHRHVSDCAKRGSTLINIFRCVSDYAGVGVRELQAFK